MIVGLFPELSAPGGVQRAGRLTAAVLASFAARRGYRCSLLSLNDPPDSSPLRVGAQEIAFAGYGRSKAGFLANALGAALRQPRLVVAFHPHLAPVATAMKVCAPRARTVIFTHGIEVWLPLAFPRRWALRQADLVLAPSTDTQQKLLSQQGLDKKRTRRLPWSLGPEFFLGAAPCDARRVPEGFPEGRVILTVGRWDAREAYKGVDQLILSLRSLLPAVPELHLVAIGDGTDLPRLQRLAQDLGVAGRVRFLRHVEPEDLSAAYDLCDVFALPSRGEGFGLVFLEAMSHAKPVIGGAHGGTPEIVEDGNNGYLVMHGDVIRLTELLLHLLTDELFRRQMGARAQERVHRDFMFDRFSGEFSALLEALLGA